MKKTERLQEVDPLAKITVKQWMDLFSHAARRGDWKAYSELGRQHHEIVKAL